MSFDKSVYKSAFDFQSSNASEPSYFEFLALDPATNLVYIVFSNGRVVIYDVEHDAEVCYRALPVPCSKFAVSKYCCYYLGQNNQLMLLRKSDLTTISTPKILNVQDFATFNHIFAVSSATKKALTIFVIKSSGGLQEIVKFAYENELQSFKISKDFLVASFKDAYYEYVDLKQQAGWKRGSKDGSEAWVSTNLVSDKCGFLSNADFAFGSEENTANSDQSSSEFVFRGPAGLVLYLNLPDLISEKEPISFAESEDKKLAKICPSGSIFVSIEEDHVYYLNQEESGGKISKFEVENILCAVYSRKLDSCFMISNSILWRFSKKSEKSCLLDQVLQVETYLKKFLGQKDANEANTFWKLRPSEASCYPAYQKVASVNFKETELYKIYRIFSFELFLSKQNFEIYLGDLAEKSSDTDISLPSVTEMFTRSLTIASNYEIVDKPDSTISQILDLAQQNAEIFLGVDHFELLLKVLSEEKFSDHFEIERIIFSVEVGREISIEQIRVLQSCSGSKYAEKWLATQPVLKLLMEIVPSAAASSESEDKVEISSASPNFSWPLDIQDPAKLDLIFATAFRTLPKIDQKTFVHQIPCQYFQRFIEFRKKTAFQVFKNLEELVDSLSEKQIDIFLDSLFNQEVISGYDLTENSEVNGKLVKNAGQSILLRTPRSDRNSHQSRLKKIPKSNRQLRLMTNTYRDIQALETRQVDRLLKQGRYKFILVKHGKGLNETRREYVESQLSVEELIEYYLLIEEYRYAYAQLKRLHRNSHDLLEILLHFCSHCIPDRCQQIKTDLLLDVLYQETVTTEEACQVMNKQAWHLCQSLPEVFDAMPELGILGVKDLKECLAVLGERLVESEFLAGVFEDFPVEVSSLA